MIIFLEIGQNRIIVLRVHPQVLNCNCVVSVVSVYSLKRSYAYETYGQVDRRIGGQMDRLTGGHMDRWTGGQMDRWTDGQSDRWTDALTNTSYCELS